MIDDNHNTYQEAAQLFINTAFNLLGIYQISPTSIDPNQVAYLDGDYGLRISRNGELNLLDPYGNLIAHTFNKRYSQYTYVGRLLAIYLQRLQEEE